MTNEQCTNVAETAWNLANEPDTDFAASVSLRDCAITIKELQSRIAELEKDAARYQWLREQHNKGDDSVTVFIGDEQHGPGHLDAQIDTAMQKD